MASHERLVVADDLDGMRLDQIVATLVSVGSRGRARKAIASGKVSLDGHAMGAEDAGTRCRAGAVVEVWWNRPGTAGRGGSRRRLDAVGVTLLHEDALLLAFDKPPGMLTDAATRAQRRDEQTLTDHARAWVGRGDVWPVHRIDRDTSGVVLFAKNQRAKDALKAQWEGEKPRRVYLAILQGILAEEAMDWVHVMRWNGRARRQEPCDVRAPGAVEARCRVRVVERLAGATVVEVALDTGRRNQIRLSACLAGHALVGERQYTPARVGVADPRHRGLPSLGRQALHAVELTVRHPGTDKPLTLRAPLPRDLARWRGKARQSSQ